MANIYPVKKKSILAVKMVYNTKMNYLPLEQMKEILQAHSPQIWFVIFRLYYAIMLDQCFIFILLRSNK